jgi:hypothetical protein
VDRVVKDDKDDEHLYLISEYMKDSLAKRLASPGPYDFQSQGKVSEFLLTIVCKIVLQKNFGSL